MEKPAVALPLPEQLPPPRAFRTDTIGIFLVLFAAGLAQLINQTPGAVRRVAEGSIAADVWEVTLVTFGLIGLVSTFMPKSKAIIGLGMELIARLGLGFGALTYGLAVGANRGFLVAEFAVLTYLGISGLMLVAAVQILGWLRTQRRVVDQYLDLAERGES